MQNADLKIDQIEQRILDLISSSRGRVLDVVEAQLGATPNWRIVRSQLLNIFGEKGLSGDVLRTINQAFGRESEQ